MDDGLVACSDETMYKEFIATMSKDFDWGAQVVSGQQGRAGS